MAATLVLFCPGESMGEDAAFGSWSRRTECVVWDGQASQAIVRKVAGPQDTLDIQRLAEDLARMRRARRNCDLGMVGDACEDYLAIMRDIARASDERRYSIAACSRAIADGLDGRTAGARPE
ncbi:MAG: hypothetical protein K2Y71_04750 [Xanthobacteraceae bacterium]|nr:hypothetical protein [Xanthobacteraceae bacterium]